MKRQINKIIFLIFMLIFQTAATAKDYTERIGDKVQILIPGIGLASALFYENHGEDGKNFEGAQQWLKAFVTFELMTEGLKLVSHKPRPNGLSFKSFPSGHTAAAFMGASFIHLRYGVRYAMPAYLGAAFVGYSRMHAKKHYGEDVFAGAAIGIASSAFFTKQYKGITFAPLVSNDMIGIAFNKEW